ncbi:MAG: TonB dependent receptor [Bacteroidetes bacterium]|jgi:outer membrane receptor protein involved in Fe transport|nr:TonB dependent receptor [Bacteroidota bacterium]MDF1867661.1 TonB-dependent receptor [Saprospiraceae bacterium]
MKLIYTIFLSVFSTVLMAQSASLKGQLQDADGHAIIFANIALYNTTDSTMAKVETTDETGVFHFQKVKEGNYFLTATYVGLSDLTQKNLQLSDGNTLDLGILFFEPQAVELSEVVVKTTRAMVEVKPDRTIFNVQGTINSVGANAIELLRKAPSVTVDNNDNISVLGRSGVMVYVDGRRLPLGGADLTAYLQNLTADQIDRIDIITNPGAKYEAEGNAGIVDIRLKKDKNLGANASLNGTFTQGQLTRYNLSASGNYRNRKMNTFGTLGYNDNNSFHIMNFQNFQNGLFLDEINDDQNTNEGVNLRLGTDFFISKNQTFGFLIDAGNTDGTNLNFTRINIGQEATQTQIDSILVAENSNFTQRKRGTVNLNYRFDNRKGRSLNIDLDYGRYENSSERIQPNQYFDADEENLMTEVINSYDTPTDIDIITGKLDFEEEIWGGKLGLGAKISHVGTRNTFLVFDGVNGSAVRDDSLSNRFNYDENVNAGYISFARPLGKKWNFSAGLRAEHSDIHGDLIAFLPELQEPPVDSNYVSWFPSVGLTWNASRNHSWSVNYGRRINRPDYNVLNPFNNRMSEISFQKGNPFLTPEIVNNIELGYTYAYRFNFKLGYSKTDNQITRLIAPSKGEDPRDNFISWDNIAKKTVISFSASLPLQVTEWWSAYMNIGASHINNQADYGDDAVIDVQAFTYSIYQQHTFNLIKGIKGEISGYFSGPGIWGGVFKYEETWSLNIGLQRKFFEEKLNVRLSANDLFYESGWNGVSVFDGLRSVGNGRWDSRNVAISLSYNFGNQNVKSRKRKIGLENEAGRVGG